MTTTLAPAPAEKPKTIDALLAQGEQPPVCMCCDQRVAIIVVLYLDRASYENLCRTCAVWAGVWKDPTS